MGLKPLPVAIAAMVILIASVGFEVIFHRTYAVEVQGPTGWQTVGTAGGDGSRGRYSEPYATRAGDIIVAERNGTIEFRVRVDNGYPWSFSEAYDVRYNGVIVAEGDIAADSRSAGMSTFTVPASTFFASMARDPSTSIIFPYLDIQIGSTYLSGSFQLKEAA